MRTKVVSNSYRNRTKHEPKSYETRTEIVPKHEPKSQGILFVMRSITAVIGLVEHPKEPRLTRLKYLIAHSFQIALGALQDGFIVTLLVDIELRHNPICRRRQQSRNIFV